MASKEQKGVDAEAQKTQLMQRAALNNAYSSLEGQKAIQSFLAFTFEEALQNQIDLIEGEGTVLRPNQIDQVKGIEENVIKAVSALKQIPPENFVRPDASKDVNTEVEQTA